MNLYRREIGKVNKNGLLLLRNSRIAMQVGLIVLMVLTGAECNSSCREGGETSFARDFHRRIRRASFQPPRSREITSTDS